MSDPNESKNDSRFPVLMCVNALMKLYSLLLVIDNDHSYLELVLMSQSSVQFMICI